LSIWWEAAFLSQQTCGSFGTDLAKTGESAVVVGLPATWHGIYFLKNGFVPCVLFNSNASAGQIQLMDNSNGAPSHSFYWNGATDRLEKR
jgi:hypothetical protein